MEYMTLKAIEEIEKADVIVGYHTYVELIRTLIPPNAEIIVGGMGGEVERAETAIEKAMVGKRVVVISSGDAGVYGMAGPIIEAAEKWAKEVPIEVVPGVTAATAAASKLGAPLMSDFAVISLSDILTPWTEIERRLKAAAEADFVIVLYNPKSRSRYKPLEKAHEILLKYRSKNTPIGIVQNAGRKKEQVTVTTLEDMLNYRIDMATTIIVGNSKTRLIKGKIVTPRGYKI